ncbi:MAG: hypothetical protein PF541_14870 [Prolixibacteraceae bacterium]|jgi:predicted Fe-Mo cluster-binding NifX family protein|nr:hypothetical protein [Prolixibacteraceae bacterium]
MRIVIPISDKSKTSTVSKKFARSPHFAVVDKTDRTVEVIENPYADLNLGVGKKLLNWLTKEYKVDTLLAFELGLKVQQLANESKMQLIIINEKKQTLKQLLSFMKIE